MRVTTVILSILLSLTAAQAVAQGTGVELGGFTNPDPDAPVEIIADRLDLKRAEGTALFTGNVFAKQGEMRLNAQWVLVEYQTEADGSAGTEIEKITAREDVLIVTPTEAAEGDEAVYRPLVNEVDMRGNVLLTQGGNTVAGDRLVVDLETGVGEVTGRVRTVLQPAEPPQ